MSDTPEAHLQGLGISLNTTSDDTQTRPELDTSPVWTEGVPTSPPEREWPPPEGHIYCERCFRDDCARYFRIRDVVSDVIDLLGGDRALSDLQEMARGAKEAEEQYKNSLPASAWLSGGAYADDNKGSKTRSKRKRKPPPQGQQQEGESANSRYLRLSLIRLPSDIKLLFLLRRYLLRARSRLKAGPSRRQGQEKESVQVAGEFLNSLRREVGLSAHQAESLEKGYNETILGLVDDWPANEALEQSGRNFRSREWWKFDETLLEAHRQLSSTSASPMSSSPQSQPLMMPPFDFDATLATKAMNVAVNGFFSNEEQKKKKGKQRASVEELTRFRRTAGFDKPTAGVLRKIGEEIATSASAFNKNQKDPQTPANNEPPRKRQRSSSSSRPSSSPTPSGDSACLPCLYCSESEAVLQRKARNQHTLEGSLEEARYPNKPWVKPLMWLYGLDEVRAAHVTAMDFFRMMDERGAIRATVAGLTILVDGTGDKRRIVLEKMKSELDELLEWEPQEVLRGEGRAGLDSGRREFQPVLGLGLLENWKSGKLLGSSTLE